METLTDWTTELPARIGWYNASTERDGDCRRYWHGTHWSAPVYIDAAEAIALRARTTMGESQFPEVEWRGLSVAAMASMNSRC